MRVYFGGFSASLFQMSALGHKRTWRQARRMSALPPKVDMCSALAYVRFGPIADIAQFILFNHLVSARKHGGRDGKAERSGGLEVDRQLIFGR
jgi:hypothetical protein